MGRVSGVIVNTKVAHWRWLQTMDSGNQHHRGAKVRTPTDKKHVMRHWWQMPLEGSKASTCPLPPSCVRRTVNPETSPPQKRRTVDPETSRSRFPFPSPSPVMRPGNLFKLCLNIVCRLLKIVSSCLKFVSSDVWKTELFKHCLSSFRNCLIFVYDCSKIVSSGVWKTELFKHCLSSFRNCLTFVYACSTIVSSQQSCLNIVCRVSEVV